MDMKRLRLSQKTQFEHEIKANFDAIKRVMLDLKLPLHALEKSGIKEGKFRAIYPLLVLLYFMYHMGKQESFSADFKYPVDKKLAAFLQSDAAFWALERSAMARPVRPFLGSDEVDERSPPEDAIYDRSEPESRERSDHEGDDDERTYDSDRAESSPRGRPPLSYSSLTSASPAKPTENGGTEEYARIGTSSLPTRGSRSQDNAEVLSRKQLEQTEEQLEEGAILQEIRSLKTLLKVQAKKTVSLEREKEELTRQLDGKDQEGIAMQKRIEALERECQALAGERDSLQETLSTSSEKVSMFS